MTAKSRLIKYGGSAAASLVMSFLTFSIYGKEKFLSSPLVDQYRILCDTFSVPGVMLIMAGLLVLVSNQGAFEGIGYALRHAVKMLVPGPKKMETYYDYLKRKRGKKITGYGFLFVTGLVNLFLAGIFMALFYNLYG